jgi:hypothetical protein
MKTAVEFLMDKLFDPTFDNQKQIEWFEQAKEMEKNQIIDAYYEGKEYGFKEHGEEYYNETFKNK